MPQLISYGRELLRIGPGNKIEYSTNDGCSWYTRYTGSSAGEFLSLVDGGKEHLENTSRR